MNKNKQDVAENIRNLKKSLLWGDYNVIIENIKKQYNITYSRSAIASCLNPHSDYFNQIIYTEALKLSIERKKAKCDLTELERQLND